MKLEMRAWHKKEKWMDGVWLVDIEHGLLCFTAHNQSEMKDCVLMLWIGLVDKNGVKIYEGDIIEHEVYDRPYSLKRKLWKVRKIVEWDDGFNKQDRPSKFNMRPQFRGTAINYEDGCWGFDWSEFHDCEVIGNTYENPELLTLNKLIGGEK